MLESGDGNLGPGTDGKRGELRLRPAGVGVTARTPRVDTKGMPTQHRAKRPAQSGPGERDADTSATAVESILTPEGEGRHGLHSGGTGGAGTDAREGLRHPHVHAGAQLGGEERPGEATQGGRDPSAADHLTDEERARLPAAQRKLIRRRRAYSIPDHGNAPLAHNETQRHTTKTQRHTTKTQPRPTRDARRRTRQKQRGASRPSAFFLPMTEREVNEVVAENLLASRPLVSFVEAVIRRNNDQVADAASNEGYLSPAWWFAAELRGHPDLADLEAWEAVLHLEEAVADLWAGLPSEDSRGVEVDPREDFLGVWSRVAKPIKIVTEPADVLPLVEQYPLDSERYPSLADEPYRRTASLCWWYSMALEGDRFWMACRTVEATIGVPYRTAAGHLRRLVGDGLLDVTADLPRSTRMAREYRINTDAVALATDVMIEAIGAGR